MKKAIKVILIILIVLGLIAAGIGCYFHFFIRNVTFKDDNGTILYEVRLKKGEAVSVPQEPTKHNCEFIEWRKDGQTYDFKSEVNDDITLVAEWKYFYDVKFMDEDESELAETQRIEKGNKVSEPEKPYKKFNDFLGWKNGEELFNFDSPIEQDINLIASWQKYEKYDLDVYGFHCAVKEKAEYGYDYNPIKKVKKGLKFLCYMGAEIRGNEHYFKTISYQLEYGKGIKLLKSRDDAKVENNVRTIVPKIPTAAYDQVEYDFEVIDVSDPNELYVGIKDYKFTATDDKFYYADDRIITDLTKSQE